MIAEHGISLALELIYLPISKLTKPSATDKPAATKVTSMKDIERRLQRLKACHTALLSLNSSLISFYSCNYQPPSLPEALLRNIQLKLQRVHTTSINSLPYSERAGTLVLKEGL